MLRISAPRLLGPKAAAQSRQLLAAMEAECDGTHSLKGETEGWELVIVTGECAGWGSR